MKSMVCQVIKCQACGCSDSILVSEKMVKLGKKTSYLWYKFKLWKYVFCCKYLKKYILPVSYALDKEGWKVCGVGFSHGNLYCKHCTEEFERKHAISHWAIPRMGI